MSEVLAPEPLLTAEQFYDGYATRDERFELVDGRVVEMSPVGPLHGDVDSNLHFALKSFLRGHALGRVYLNTGFILRRNPDLVRGPDEAFVSNERIAANPPPKRGFWPVAPDLALEIISAGDLAEELTEKVGDYLETGVRLIWVVYPRTQQVHVYHPNGDVRIVRGEGTLDGSNVLTGFEVPLGELWE